MNATVDKHTLLVVTISNSESFQTTVRSALAGLAAGERHVRGHDGTLIAEPSEWTDVCETLASRARIFLDEVLSRVTIQVVTARRFDEISAKLRDAMSERVPASAGPQPWISGATVLFVVDAATAVPGQDTDSRLDAAMQSLRRLGEEFGFGLSPYSVFIYDQLDEDRVYSRTGCTYRQKPAENWVLAAETIRAFTDLIQARHVNTKALMPDTDEPATLATALTSFLTEQANRNWGLHFFTGSIVSKLIQDATLIARRAGNPTLRGPNEHSLACGALARWQLHDAPFLLVVTSGMASELKGTLANLRDSQARGFIVIGENEPDAWQPFQGTMHNHEDSRAVFQAQGLQALYLHNANRLQQDLAAAFRAYHRRRGPVVLLVSPSVLRYTGTLSLPDVVTATPRPSADLDTLESVAAIVNHEPSPLVWQCGKLTDIEREFVHDIAQKAGIALVDALGRPGTVSRYHKGRVVDEYLGTMGLYGCSPEVWELLHPDGHLLNYHEHALFFLRSRIQDLSTPFPEKVLLERARVVQVTDNGTHVAPFTDIPVIEELESFLRRLAERVDPPPRVVAARREAMNTARLAGRDPLVHVPSIPMSHEYFFTKLNDVLTGLIDDHNYDYTGFYDVGRGGISAVRNLVRTRPGFSGWYGRALMGDALLAIPSVALSDPGNILGFIGDGAANLVPSILPSLAQQLRYEGGHIEGNVSIFFLLNGGFSIIRSYRELQHAATADAQMSLLTPVAPNWQEVWGDVTVTHERVTTVDQEHLAKRLLEPATINLFSVYLSHDNEGDDIMPLSRKNWRMR